VRANTQRVVGDQMEHYAAELPGRARIVDRHGVVLAESWYSHDLVLNAKDLVRPRDEDELEFGARFAASVVLAALGDAGVAHRVADVRRAVYEGVLHRDKWIRVVRDLDPRQRRRVGDFLSRACRHGADPNRKARLWSSGIRFDARLERTYPQGAATAQVVGMVGETTRDAPERVAGRSGIELLADRVLTGRPGVLRTERDSAGTGLMPRWFVQRPVRTGADVVLTIDARIQGICVDALAKSTPEHRAKSGSAIVLDARSGDVLAAASWPTVDPEALRSGHGSAKALRLPALVDRYEPGSIIKPVIVAWGLQEKAISLQETWDCGGNQGYRMFGRRRVREFHTNLEPLSTERVLIRSSNIGSVRIGWGRLGIDRLWGAFAAWGLAGRISVAYPGVPRASYFTRAHMSRPGYDRLNTGISFCQGYALVLTPLGMARMYLPFANGGEISEPTLLREIRNGLDTTEPTRRRRVIRPDVAHDVLRVLQRVVEEGTGRALKDLPWTVAAKTGTPEITKDRALHNPVIAAIAPVTAPEIVVVVVHHEVRKRSGRPYTGGKVSGPVAKEIIAKTLEYLRVEHDR
jgi:cell division protein FtsI (penicillin-binding protein 3)